MHKSDNDIVRLSRAVLYYVATDQLSVAQLLRSEYLKEAQGDATLASRMAFDSWFTLISVYPDVERLKNQVHYDAGATTDLARVFYKNAPLFAKSILR